ncbi:glycosyltransferase [Cyclobacterium plantarum]|uniref:Glycosyltransferase family 4 protein n=1 Tax=Cyclobacterium plantarum TaxID=2716263 RepID=A0ABX0H9I3_9BACT|nr:glycosyltransferase [Cyclobacterium plantarum]NHE57116.1 glycosyltransferase family 4 protein [Cyclobacterium plantarum]
MERSSKLKLLIVNKDQFGYHVDPYKYSVYLKEDFEITHLSWDYGLHKIHQNGIEVKYISRRGFKLLRYFRFLRAIHNEIRNHAYELVFMIYFPGCSLIRRLHPTRTFNVDIRSRTVTNSPLRNRMRDLLLVNECKTFRHISIISQSLSHNLGFKNTHYLPLGGECFSGENTQKDGLYLLYVGSLDNRDIMIFVKGFHRFYLDLMSDPDAKPIHFTIVGSGSGGEQEEIWAYIQKNQLQDVISMEGFVHNDLLHHYFKKSNIGVSFIPITDYYQDQPPTKTYEYLLSGLAVIATATNENIKTINEKNGVLIQDKPEAVLSGLQVLANRMESYQPEAIRKEMENHLWIRIAQDNLKPYLMKLALYRVKKSQVLPIPLT